MGAKRGLAALLIATLLGTPLLTAANAAAQDDEIRIAYIMHGLNAFTEVIKRGAEAAGEDLGVTVDVFGQAGFDIPTHQAFFETAIQGGYDGIVVIPNGGDPWNALIEQATEAGIPLTSANNTALNSELDLWVGQDEFASGLILGDETKKALAAKGVTSGKIVVGICLPGNPVLVARYDGFVAALEGSDFEVSEAQDVALNNEENYARWENLATANQDAVAMVGLCSLDIANQAQVKERSGATWAIAGYDLDVPTLDAVKAGLADVTLGQQPYLQGYLPVRALVEEIREGKDLEGWLEVPTDIVTPANVDDYFARESDPAVEAEYYKGYIAENFADLAAAARPYDDLRSSGDAAGTPAA
jgi:ABC-type sugar transport system substrate-binding protein